jgi:hypothetical protein
MTKDEIAKLCDEVERLSEIIAVADELLDKVDFAYATRGFKKLKERYDELMVKA